jgi:hypothetical protein
MKTLKSSLDKYTMGLLIPWRDETNKLSRVTFDLDKSNDFIHYGGKYYGESFHQRMKELFTGIYY